MHVKLLVLFCGLLKQACAEHASAIKRNKLPTYTISWMAFCRVKIGQFKRWHAVWTKHAACHFYKQRVSWPESHQPLQLSLGAPWGKFRKEKNRTLALEKFRCISKKNFNEPKPQPLPVHRKALKSFTWDVWLFVIAVSFWNLTTCGCFLSSKKLLAILAPPLSLRTVPQSCLRAAIPG